MIPCLYSSAETEYITNGIGKLADCISCVVTEKRNDSYELAMEYPSDGIHADELAEGAIIYARPADNKSPQAFRIYRITTPMDGKLEVAARHISYQLNFITCSPVSVTDSTADHPARAFAALKAAATTDCPFSFVTDLASEANFAITEPTSFRNALGGVDGSMLDTFGGEFEWDMYTVKLWKSRGADNGVRIVYGKNLVDFKMEKSIEETITGVHPYWIDTETGNVVELPEKIVTITLSDMPFDKIAALDCSSEFEEEPTEDELRAYAQSYLLSTDYIEPDIDIDIDFAQLWQVPGYEDIAEAERVSLCDTVHVYVSKLGIEVDAEVTETEYDVLLERYTSITVSNSTTSSRNKSLVLSIEQEIEKMIDPYADKITKIVAIANGKTTTYYASEMPEGDAYTINDIWFDTSNGYAMYYWTGEEWLKAPYGTDALGEGSITTELLAASCVTAGKISVDKLSAISANLGSITGGSLNIGSGTFTVDTSGNVTCSSIKITGGSITLGSVFSVTSSGVLTAKSGTIGPLKITNTSDTNATSGHYAASSAMMQAYGVTAPAFDSTGDTGTVYPTVDMEWGLKSVGSSTGNAVMYLRVKKPSDVWTTNTTYSLFSLSGRGAIACSGIQIYPNRALNCADYGTSDEDISMADDEARVCYTDSTYIHFDYVKFTEGDKDDGTVGAIYSHFDPYAANKLDMGGSEYYWRRVYCDTIYRNSTASTTSDRKYKKNVAELTDEYEAFFDSLVPVSFLYTYGNSGRTHLGFIAQDVRDQALATVGDLALFNAGVIGDDLTDYEEGKYTDDQLKWGLSYEEFVPLLTKIVQSDRERISALESKIEELTENATDSN